MTNAEEASLPIVRAYDEIATNYRFFLSWRHAIFAGYLANVAAVGVALAWLYEKAGELLWLPLAAEVLVTVVFWIVDYRNRDLYHACQEAGEACEATLPAGVGIYTRLNASRRVVFTQSSALDFLFCVVAVASAVGAIWAVMR